MPSLDVQFADGRREVRPLSRSAPLSLGAQSFNDICVSGDGVGPLHCRIGWSKTGYEVTAATPKGVDLNGTIVEHAFLKPGDVLRIGTADITYLSDQPAPKAPPPEEPAKPARAGDKSPPGKAGKEPPKKEKAPVAEEDLSLFEGPVLTESMAEMLADGDVEPDEPVALSEDELPVDSSSRKSPAAAPPGKAGVVSQLGRELQGGRQRPGEQEILKSPIILGLGAGAVVLLLVSATIYFLMGRESATRLFDVASTDLNEGRYSQAIENFERFVELYPRHDQVEAARINIGKAQIQRELFGATPAWSTAWDRLQEFVKEFRNSPSYRELRPVVQDYAEQLALGAAKAAEAQRDATLLPISDEARALLERTADPETPLTGILSQIRDATDKANAAIARQRERDKSVAEMEKAIADGRAIDALSERDRLLRTHPMYGSDRGVQSVLQQALAQAASTVQSLEIGPPPATEPESALPRNVLPVFHQRSRTDEASLGQTVWVLAQDSCFAVDTVTGELVWRRPIGADPPFAPVATRGAQPGWLLYDRRTNELVHCRSDNGETLWRLPLSAVPQGAPLVGQSQIYLALSNQTLLRIDQETGEVTAGLKFAQGIQGPPAVNADDTHLFIAGSRGLIYTLSKRPLECVAVTFTDHPDGAVPAPLATLGQMLLVCQNDQPDRSNLRVFDASDPTKPLPPVDSDPIDGAVFDPPVLRGPQLVVPSRGERLTAFVVNDDPGRMGITKVGDYRVQDGYGGPIRVMLGPDNQFWMSSTAFRRFEIGADSLRMAPNPVAVGLTSQPLQAVSEMFFVGRRLPFGEAVHFTNIDRDRMTGTWRTALGARPRALLARDSGPVVLVTDSGFVYTIGPNRLASGGAELRSGFSLELPPTLDQPLQIGPLSDGRAVIAAAGDAPQLWIVETTGRVGPPLKLSAPVECPPVLVDAGLILPTQGRLQVRPLTGNTRYQEWLAPAEGVRPPAWAHLLRTSGDEVIAADVEGRWRRLELRGGDVPHLAEAVQVAFPPPSTVAPILRDDHLLMFDSQNTLWRLDVRNLEEKSKRTFPNPLRGCSVLDHQTALVWDDRTLRLVSLEQGLDDHWVLDLPGQVPVGQAVQRAGQAILGCVNGAILTIDLEQGRIVSQQSLPQSLSLGVVQIPGGIWAVAVDGTLYRLADASEGQP